MQSKFPKIQEESLPLINHYSKIYSSRKPTQNSIRHPKLLSAYRLIDYSMERVKYLA